MCGARGDEAMQACVGKTTARGYYLCVLAEWTIEPDGYCRFHRQMRERAVEFDEFARASDTRRALEDARGLLDAVALTLEGPALEEDRPHLARMAREMSVKINAALHLPIGDDS
jgi:hypothetical protein